MAESVLSQAAKQEKPPQVKRGAEDRPKNGPPTPAQAPAGAYRKCVTVYCARIHYIERGNGPVVVLVHGEARSIET